MSNLHTPNWLQITNKRHTFLVNQTTNSVGAVKNQQQDPNFKQKKKTLVDTHFSS
jgi:hypothetical protein